MQNNLSTYTILFLIFLFIFLQNKLNFFYLIKCKLKCQMAKHFKVNIYERKQKLYDDCHTKAHQTDTEMFCFVLFFSLWLRETVPSKDHPASETRVA